LIASLVLYAALAAGAEVTIKPLSGESREGELVALSATKVVVRTGDAESTLPAAELLSVDFAAREDSPRPATWIELLDGSRLHCVGVTVADGKARAELTCGQTVELPTRSIRFIRFREQDAAISAQWREIVAGPATGDMVVVRKTSMRTEDNEEQTTVSEVALDQLEGTVLAVSPESVQFEFDGEKIDVRREKLDGIVYFQPTKREFSAPACRVVDSGGSVWAVSGLESKADQLALQTVGGAAVTLPLAAIAKVDYSAGNVAFLAELEPDTGGDAPTVSLQPAAMVIKFGSVFSVRARPPLGATAFQIDGQRYDGGLSLHSPLTLVYRVPTDFRRLRAVAGIDDSIVAPGEFNLVILGDGKELLRQAFGAESRGPLAIDLDLTGVRRVTIQLDPADGQDIGDQLNLCEARLTK
jgi:hypothetical protein